MTNVNNELYLLSKDDSAVDLNFRNQHVAQSLEIHEIRENLVSELDVLETLKANMHQLAEMHSRLHFMMAEISYLLVKSS